MMRLCEPREPPRLNGAPYAIERSGAYYGFLRCRPLPFYPENGPNRAS